MLSEETRSVMAHCIQRDIEHGETLTHKTCLKWLDGLLADHTELEETVQALGLQLTEARVEAKALMAKQTLESVLEEIVMQGEWNLQLTYRTVEWYCTIWGRKGYHAKIGDTPLAAASACRDAVLREVTTDAE